MPTSETQLTTAPHGHILTNVAIWSPDSQWIVYDVRSDPAGSVFDGTRIERVNVKTKRIEVLYESKNGACVGAATVNPVDGRVVFMHGPEFPTPDWSYSACHREGVIVDPAKPGVGVPLEARDVVAPFTRGALRGGTHVHTWDPTGSYVSFTYEDHVLTHGTAEGKEPNRRTIGIAYPDSFTVVPKSHVRNRDGQSSEVSVQTFPNPKPGSDEIGRAIEDGWNPPTKAAIGCLDLSQTFIGEVIAKDGRKVNELFLSMCSQCCSAGFPQKLQGTTTTMPENCCCKPQICLTRFADIPGHIGITTTLRNWPRMNSKSTYIAFLTGSGSLNIIPFDVQHPLTRYPVKTLPITVSSAFTWHPDGRHLAAVVDESVCLIDVETGQVTPLTAPSDPPPRPEACVVSPDGSKVAFVRTVGGVNQVFVVEVPAAATK